MATNPAPTPAQIKLATSHIRRELLNLAGTAAFTPQGAASALASTEQRIRWHAGILENGGLLASSPRRRGKRGRPPGVYAITQPGSAVAALFPAVSTPPTPAPLMPAPARPSGLVVLLELDEDTRRALEDFAGNTDIVVDLMAQLGEGPARRVFRIREA
jgi:hypothetical protein